MSLIPFASSTTYNKLVDATEVPRYSQHKQLELFTWEFDITVTIHTRSIVTDIGWKISLDHGLDIFQKYAMNDTFSLAN